MLLLALLLSHGTYVIMDMQSLMTDNILRNSWMVKTVNTQFVCFHLISFLSVNHLEKSKTAWTIWAKLFLAMIIFLCECQEKLIIYHKNPTLNCLRGRYSLFPPYVCVKLNVAIPPPRKRTQQFNNLQQKPNYMWFDSSMRTFWN